MVNIFKKAKRNEHHRAGWENHPVYAAGFDYRHTGPYLFTPNRSHYPRASVLSSPWDIYCCLLGLLLWGTAVIQLLTGFSKGKLVTTGAYGVVRNPIYSSVTFFILPAVALITLTWVYFVPSVFLYAGVMIFIGVEEKQLTQAFGKQYQDYMARVDRLVPFKKP